MLRDFASCTDTYCTATPTVTACLRVAVFLLSYLRRVLKRETALRLKRTRADRIRLDPAASYDYGLTPRSCGRRPLYNPFEAQQTTSTGRPVPLGGDSSNSRC